MKKIIFDCERMKYSSTGLYHYCLSLGVHIEKKLNKSQEALTFYSPQNAVDVFGTSSLHIYQNSLQKFYMPKLKGFDVWHSTFQNSNYIPVRNKKIKVVLTIHDLNFLHENNTQKQRFKNLHHLQQNIKRSNAIVCISEFCKNDVLDYCKVGNKPIHVIHNGTNSLAIPELIKSSYKPKRPFLFSLGAVCRKKNFHVLLPLLQKNQHMELLIAGRPDDTDYLDFIQKLAVSLRVQDKLRMLGVISEPEKAWYYNNCYAFAMPSIAEGFGLPVAEAMSVGKPVFLSDKTSLPEIGKDVAFYFRDFSANHMQHVFADGMQQYKQNNMADAIREHSETFNWDKAASDYINVYRSLY
jgi:glycosyltransferase involved in cell wall biosynthesis